MSGYLIDTSVFIAAEQTVLIGAAPPGQGRISVATLTELRIGTLRSPTAEVREFRIATLRRARRFVALPYDERVADALAELYYSLHRRQRRAGGPDAIIAATALVHGLAIWTLDADFERLARVVPELRVIRADAQAPPPTG